MIIIGNNIRILRELFKESIEALADAINVNTRTLRYYESGDRTPSEETIKLIAEHYELPITLLKYKDLSPWSDLDLSQVIEFLKSEKSYDKDYPILVFDNDKYNHSDLLKNAMTCHYNLITAEDRRR